MEVGGEKRSLAGKPGDSCGEGKWAPRMTGGSDDGSASREGVAHKEFYSQEEQEAKGK